MNELTFLWWVTMLWVGSSRTSYLRRRRRSLFECVLFECVYKHSMTSMLNWIPSTFCHTLFCLSVHSKTIISINSNYCFEFCWEVSLSGSSFFRVALAGAKRRLVKLIKWRFSVCVSYRSILIAFLWIRIPAWVTLGLDVENTDPFSTSTWR